VDSMRRCGVRMSQRWYCYSAVKCRDCGAVVWFKNKSLCSLFRPCAFSVLTNYVECHSFTNPTTDSVYKTLWYLHPTNLLSSPLQYTKTIQVLQISQERHVRRVVGKGLVVGGNHRCAAAARGGARRTSGLRSESQQGHTRVKSSSS